MDLSHLKLFFSKSTKCNWINGTKLGMAKETKKLLDKSTVSRLGRNRNISFKLTILQFFKYRV